jgi:Tfp pilus assembly protein PilV
VKTLRNTRGLSIVELMVTSALIGICIFGVAGFLQSANFKNTSSKEHTAGAALIEKTMEEQKTIGYAAVASGGDTVTVEANGVSYTRTWTVSDVTANGVSGRLRKVAVLVRWGTGSDKQIQSAVYLARPK